MQNAGVLRQPLIAVADSLSFRADLNERGAKVRRFAPTCVPTQQGQSITAICAFETFEATSRIDVKRSFQVAMVEKNLEGTGRF